MCPSRCTVALQTRQFMFMFFIHSTLHTSICLSLGSECYLSFKFFICICFFATSRQHVGLGDSAVHLEKSVKRRLKLAQLDLAPEP